MSLEIHSFAFGEFTLDVREKVLLQGGKRVSVTPKAVNLLIVLLDNRGHLVEKDKLISAVWTENFVEEGNLTFTVGLLRKVLGDTAQNPRFIETVPRRGYRFIHEVKGIKNEPESESIPADGRKPENQKSKTGFIFAFAAALVVGAFAFGGWIFRSGTVKEISILKSPFTADKLSTNGKVFHAVISPDGKNVIYTNGSRGERQSVWLRQLDSGNNVELIPPSDGVYLGLAVSPDDNFLYFSRAPKNAKNQADIYRTSLFGAVPQKIIGETQGWISISPDGAKVSFVRCYYRPEENCSLWIADSADGKNEKKLTSRPLPYRIADNEFSPDGKRVIFAVGQSENQANEFGLMEIDLKTAEEHEFTPEKFFNVKSLEWLPDGKNLLFTASRITDRNFRIWQISVGGKAEPLTKDSESYSSLSISNNGVRMVSTRVREEFRLRLFEMNVPSASRALVDASTAAFAPDGEIYFTSQMSGNYEIWVIKKDGDGQRQLTNNAADESRPVVSFDGNSIFFFSNRTGAAHVWRMNPDGSNQTQITRTEGGFPIFASPDGAWLYYHHGIKRTLWRVSLKNREEQRVLDKSKFRFAISPEASQIAFSEKRGEEKFIVIVSATDGKVLKTFKYPDSSLLMPELIWMPDGKALTYVLADSEFKNNTLWLQPLDGKQPQQITGLGNEEISEAGGLAISPDGKSFAVSQGGWRHDAVLITGIK